jgi:hypothetical protein
MIGAKVQAMLVGVAQVGQECLVGHVVRDQVDLDAHAASGGRIGVV